LDEEGELLLRWHIWKTRWFPYRTARWRGFDEKNDIIVDSWKWHLPDKWTGRWK
jgi:hypothetical protein